MVEIDALLAGFRLQPVGQDRFVARNVPHGAHVVRAGQLIGQSIVAALVGRERKMVSTIHTLFARSVTFDKDLEIAVESSQDSEVDVTATVSVRQDGRDCTRSLAVLCEMPMGVAPRETDFVIPDGFPAPAVTTRREGSWELSVVDNVDLRDPKDVGPPEISLWSRIRGAPRDAELNQALVAFMTDGFLIGAAMRPHRGVGQGQAHQTLSTGVLSHTLTFHSEAWAGDWLLISQRSTYAGHGRTYGVGEVRSPGGHVVARFAQDAMIRARVGGPGAL